MVAAALAVVPLPAASWQAEPHAAVERLRAFEGSWRTDRVEFLDDEGRVRRVAGAAAHNELRLDGHVLVHRGRLDDPAIETQGWYYWNAETGRLHMGSVTNSGRYDEFAGDWEGDRLVMTTLPSEALGDRIFRMTHSELTGDTFLETMAVSEDGGETWRTTHRQRMSRADGSGMEASSDARAILDALGAYTGHWQTRTKQDQAGNAFRFEYDLAWMDPGRTIARMLIERVESDGSRSTVFEGYKGREPSGEEVYYFAASPSGRASRGTVFREGDDLITLYQGWTADGDVVEIRDVFRPVEDGAFLSRTFLRPSPDADWRQIGEDRWRVLSEGSGEGP